MSSSAGASAAAPAEPAGVEATPESLEDTNVEIADDDGKEASEELLARLRQALFEPGSFAPEEDEFAELFDLDVLNDAKPAPVETIQEKFQVRDTEEIGDGEKAYVKRREVRCRKALNRLLKAHGKAPLVDGARLPRVALCFSGGGFRALLGTATALSVLKKEGILDVVTHMAGLSGSSWCLVPWVSTLYNQRSPPENPFVGDATVKDPWTAELYGDAGGAAAAPETTTATPTPDATVTVALEDQSRLVKRFSKTKESAEGGMTPEDRPTLGMLLRMMAMLVAQGRPLRLTDPYGAWLAMRLLPVPLSQRLELGFSDLAAKFFDVDTREPVVPYPIVTAVMPFDSKSESKPGGSGKQWVEFTPHEFAVPYLKAAVPMQGFGFLYQNGEDQRDHPSLKGLAASYQSQDKLHYIMGTAGSAFAAEYSKLLPKRGPVGFVAQPLLKILDRFSVVHNVIGKRATPVAVTKVPNPNFGRTGRMDDTPNLKLIDAGIHFNLPLPVLVEQRRGREIDVVIAVDCSQGAKGPSEVAKATDFYAKRKDHKQSFYEKHDVNMADEKDKTKRAVLRFKDAADCPSLVYISHHGDRGAPSEGTPPKSTSFYYRSTAATRNVDDSLPPIEPYAGNVRENVELAIDTILAAIAEQVDRANAAVGAAAAGSS